MRRLMMTVAGLALTAIPGQAGAKADRQATAEPREAVAAVRRQLAERYVLTERRAALDAVLARGLSSGRYDGVDPASLAERVSADLASVGQDKHLSFSYDPRAAAMLGNAPVDDRQSPEAFAREARAANFGVRALSVLPGNIRYMDYAGFTWTGAESAAAIDQAMRFLSGGDAVIIDLRRNGGGSPVAVQYLVSHFLPADRPLVAFHMGGRAEPERMSTLSELPAGRMIGKPLYVLTSPGSASAAEEFAGHVAGFKIGELVGAPTAGAAFRNELVPIAGGYVLSISVGRPVLASTGRDWEGTGIAPTIPADGKDALAVAELHALKRLAGEGPAEVRATRGALAEVAEARLNPRAAARPIDAYAGSFGVRRVTAEDGRLYYQLEDRPRVALIPLGGDRFALESDPALRIDFAASNDAVSALSISPAGAPPMGRYPRTG